jgi:hypothetical protein
MLVGRGDRVPSLRRAGINVSTPALTDAAVPTTPEWTITDLVEHVGRSQHWVAEIIERRITDPTQLPKEMAFVVQGRPATSGQGRGGTTFTANRPPRTRQERSTSTLAP